MGLLDFGYGQSQPNVLINFTIIIYTTMVAVAEQRQLYVFYV